jgi:CRP/FNR family transcriptional regulator
MRADLRAERVKDAIATIAMFRGLTPEVHRQLASLATVKDFARGDHLWHEGDPSEAFTILLKGRVKIVRELEQGDVIYEIFGDGEPIGAIAVYNYIPYPASAVALEPVSILSLPRRDYFELLDRYPEFARGIIRELTRMVMALTRKLDEMRGQRVDVRIAQLFLTLAERMGKETKEGVEIPIQLSRQEVADLVGTTAETAIRILSRWGREGVLISGEKRFVIPSREGLRQVASGEEE